MADPTGVPRWYAEWARNYAVAWLLPAEWIDAALAWWPSFATLDATADELAAVALAMQGTRAEHLPRKWESHLPAVKAGLGDLRGRAAVRADPGDDRGVCTECGDTGWATVPHGKHVRDGVWRPAGHAHGEPRYVTWSVACSCGKGRHFAAATKNHRDEHPMTLSYYRQAVCPGYREQMAAVEEARAVRVRAEAAATAARPADVARFLADAARVPPV